MPLLCRGLRAVSLPRVGRPAEYRLDEGSESVEGRAQDEDVLLGEVGARLGEQVEQCVTKRLHLAQRAVAGVEADRSIGRLDRAGPGRRIGADVVLQAREQRGGGSDA